MFKHSMEDYFQEFEVKDSCSDYKWSKVDVMSCNEYKALPVKRFNQEEIRALEAQLKEEGRL